jgi:ABC-2 type transport system ATP-binding protein
VRTPDAASARRALKTLHLVPDARSAAGTVTAPLVEGVLPETVTAALVTAGVRVRGIAVSGGAADSNWLEERFVALTGEGFDVAE